MVDQNQGMAAIASGFQEAWNAHDMDAFGRLFHPDATFVNRFGTYWRGVQEIVAEHAIIHASIYRDSGLAIDVFAIDPISDEASIVHFWTRLNVGAAHPSGPHQIDTLILAVVTYRNGEWRVQAMENVTLTDPKTGVAILRSSAKAH